MYNLHQIVNGYGMFLHMEGFPMSKSLLYLSPNSSSEDKVARLNADTFIQRLNDLSKAVQSLNQLASLMKQQRKGK